MKKQTKTQKVIAFKKANPNASYAEIAKAVGTSIGMIGITLSKAGLTKKRKPKVVHKKPTKGQAILREVLKQEPPVSNVHALNVEIYNLRQQINGYVAVVSYLENKLGIGAQNGPAI